MKNVEQCDALVFLEIQAAKVTHKREEEGVRTAANHDALDVTNEVSAPRNPGRKN